MCVEFTPRMSVGEEHDVDPPLEFTVQQLAKEFGCSEKTIGVWTRMAGVKRPKHGGRGFIYKDANLAKLLRWVALKENNRTDTSQKIASDLLKKATRKAK